MKMYVINFLKRGLAFSVGGPIIVAIIYAILGVCGVIDTLTPNEVCLGIISSAAMAFVVAGIGVVYEIERLPLGLAVLIHGVTLYAVYIGVYLLNGWLQSQWVAVTIFTACFIVGYAVIWGIIYFITRAQTKQFNDRLEQKRS